ncbi:MAG: HAD family hydrolase [Dehalococcoidia bacterium]
MSEVMNYRRIGLGGFDLDGTLLRGDSVCEAIARQLGRLERMRELERARTLEEIKAGREEMRDWYSSVTVSKLCSYLMSLQLAPGVQAGFSLLKQHGVKIAIVSITWEFAVEWFAGRLGADYYVGTGPSPNGDISHFWPHDKPRWLAELTQQLGLGLNEVVAVGDSSSDLDMLRVVGHPFFVGRDKPEGLEHVSHHPDGNIHEVAQQIVGTLIRT